MIKKLNSEVQALTPELAQQFAQMKPLPGERDLKPSRLAFLRTKLDMSTFLDPDWAKGTCLENGEEYRLNGHHSSTILTERSDGQFPGDLTVTVTTWEFDSITKDGPELFNLYDNPASSRDNVDAIGIYRAQHSDLVDIDKKFLTVVGRGIHAYLASKDAVKDEDVVLYNKRDHGIYFNNEEYRQFAKWLWQFHDARHVWLLKRDAVTAEILTDWKYSVEMATEWWGWVLNESHPDEDHDSREYSRTMKDWIVAKKRRTSEQFRKYAQKFWNRYLNSKK